MTQPVAVSGFNVPTIPNAAERGTSSAAPTVPTAPSIAPAPHLVAPQPPAATPPAAKEPEGEPKPVEKSEAQPQELQDIVPAVPQDLNNFDTSTLGDEVLRTYADFLLSVRGEVDLDRAFGKALDYNDPNLIDVAYIKEKGGANAEQIHKLVTAIVERTQAVAAEIETSVHSLAGGEAQWNAAAAAFNKSAPTHVRRIVANLLNTGSPKEIEDAAKTVLAYAREGGLVAKPAQLNTPSAGGNGALALSREQFHAERAKLNPNAPDYNQQAAALFERRRQGKMLGM